MSESVGPRPLIVGEVLFDYFPSGERVLGGAPFNVAWHLHGFGLFPYFLSRIGTDPSADEIRLRMNDWGMDAGGLESDPKHPTGQVQIEFDPDGTHRFHIVPDQAYDYIDGQTHFNSAKKKPWGLLYVGTLAQRSPHSAQSIHDLFSLNVPRFVDVNLRAPWWDQATVDRTLNGAKWVKLNDEELLTLTWPNKEKNKQLAELLVDFSNHYALPTVVLTCGEKGAYSCTNGEIGFYPTPQTSNLIDTVGAGDAFSSVLISGLLLNWPIETSMQRALRFAADICQIQGATTNNREFYNKHLESWT